MSLLSKMIELSHRTRTFNGAVTYNSSADACLDLFAVGGAMRYRAPSELLSLFDRAFIENPLLAMKLLFHIRDVRGGMGERESFRKMLRHAAFLWPESVKLNVAFIPEFGRYDDLICLLGTPVEAEVIRVIRDQLNMDLKAVRRIEAGKGRVPLSLLAKWMPSINASSNRTRKHAKELAAALGMNAAEYRKTLASIRKHLHLTECLLTEGAVDRINYEAVPARSMFAHCGAFERHDRERFGEYLQAVRNGQKSIHVSTLDPHEIARPYFRRSLHPDGLRNETIELLWRAQGGTIGQQNTICVIDTSGSMFWAPQGAPVPALFSHALGIYYAERCQGAFHNYLITFESTPHLAKLHGDTLQDKLRYITSLPWQGSTNLTAVFDLILRAAKSINASQEELPSVIYIISDMEFNMALRSPDSTIFEDAKAKFEEAGYQLPALVFHNVNAWRTQVPVTAHTRGTALASGSRITSMAKPITQNTTPLSHMLEILNSERYSCIRV